MSANAVLARANERNGHTVMRDHITSAIGHRTSATHVRGTPLDAQGADAIVQRGHSRELRVLTPSMTQSDDRKCYRAGQALP